MLYEIAVIQKANVKVGCESPERVVMEPKQILAPNERVAIAIACKGLVDGLDVDKLEVLVRPF